MNRRLGRTACEETFRRLDDYLDRQLTDQEMGLVEAHLQQCAMCSRGFVFEAGIIDSVRGKLRRVSVPGGLLERISQEIGRTARSVEPARVEPESHPPVG
jgi:anti-sigma factor (TIGR02949 family)